MTKEINYSGEKGSGLKTINTVSFSDLTKGTLEAQEIQRKYEQEKLRIKTETKELLDKEKLIHQAKELIYFGLGINNDLSKNADITNFLKGMVDGLVIGNIDLAIEIINTKGKILIDALKSLTSIEGIIQMTKALGENIGELFSGDAYKKGKSLVELIIIGTGVAGTFKLTRFLVKGTTKIATKVGETGSKLIQKGIEAGKNMSGLSIKEILNLKGYEKLITIAGLEIKRRLEVAGELIKRNLTNAEKEAIEAAHKVGENRTGSGVGNYLASEIKEKIQILKNAGFSLSERKTLLFEGVCGGLPQAEQFSTWKRLVTTLEGSQKSIKETIKGAQTNLKEAVEPQLRVITKFRGKTLSEVNKVLTGEIETIGNGKSTLGRILKDIIYESGEKRWSIQKLANEYIGNRLSNLEKFIEYMEYTITQGAKKETLIGLTNHFKTRLSHDGFEVLVDSMKKFSSNGRLIISDHNMNLVNNLAGRIDAIKQITH